MTYGISVVVPVFNEEGNVKKLHKEIVDACVRKADRLLDRLLDRGCAKRAAAGRTQIRIRTDGISATWTVFS